MDHSADFQRPITMAAYMAARAIREYLGRHRGASVQGAIDVLRNTDADFACLDFVNGAQLYALVKEERGDEEFDLRSILSFLVKRDRPWWLHAVPFGRDRVADLLQPAEYQCFREAGLLKENPDPTAVAWWDEISALERADQDIETMVRARHAERLSMDYERKRLEGLGVDVFPQWVALDDNTLGFDIRSYDVSGGRVVHHLIEVKSTSSGNIHITRNEWRNAQTASQAYSFHVWWWPNQSLSVLSVDTIAENIPDDHGSGEWQDVEIRLS